MSLGTIIRNFKPPTAEDLNGGNGEGGYGTGLGTIIHNFKPPTAEDLITRPDNPYLVPEGEGGLAPIFDPTVELDYDPYNDVVAPQYLLDRREQEYKILKEAYSNIKGDTWETAIGLDSVAKQQLEAFKSRWEEILESKEYSAYDYNKGYGGYAPLGGISGKGFFDFGGTAGNSGYIGG